MQSPEKYKGDSDPNAFKSKKVFSYPQTEEVAKNFPPSSIEELSKQPDTVVARNGSIVTVFSLEDITHPDDSQRLIKELKFPNGEMLSEYLPIEKLNQELENVRENGSPDDIRNKEKEIGRKIQYETSDIEREDSKVLPDEILEENSANCVGRLLVRGTYFHKLGLEYLVLGLRRHVAMIQIIGDTPIFMDAIEGESEGEEIKEVQLPLTDNRVKGQGENSNDFRAADIVNFSRDPNSDGLRFRLIYNDGSGRYMVAFAPEVGHKLLALDHLALGFLHKKEYENAIKVCKKSLSISKGYNFARKNLAESLIAQGNHKRASMELKTVLSFNPTDSNAYALLGDILAAQGQHEEAIKEYEKALQFGKDNEDTLKKLTISRTALLNLQKTVSGS